jgi:outer membrane protein OmpA-like peptidoglycan-associated protein
MTRHPALACLLFVLATTAAMAQEVRQYRPGDAVDPREVAAILGQKPDAAPAMKMRSIRLLGDTSAAAAPASATALSLPVQFDFDSADILPAARRQLDALAEGIRLLPEAKVVVIEGHTDAVGTAQYNDQLSVRRADAVKRYLVAEQRLDPSRLRTVGKGQREPQAGSDPKSAENRRVQFRGD